MRRFASACIALSALFGFTFVTTLSQAAHAAEPAPIKLDKKLLEAQANDFVLGDAKAPVTIIEYASLSCPHCAAFHTATLPTIKERYVKTGKARFIFRDFPLNAPALRGTMLARCAGKDNKDAYYNFLEVLFAQQSQWAFHHEYISLLEKFAKMSGMSEAAFRACMENQPLETEIIQMKQKGIEGLGVKTTPSFFINGTLISGNRTVEEFANAIELAINPNAKPVAIAPKTATPETKNTSPEKITPEKTESPKTESPKTESPKTEGPKTEGPKTEGPKTEAPKKPEAEKTTSDTPKAPVTEKKPAEAKAVPEKPLPEKTIPEKITPDQPVTSPSAPYTPIPSR